MRSQAPAADAVASSPEPTTRPALLFVARLARVAFGAVFLVAAFTKIFDPALFAEQIAGYGVTPASWAAWQAPLFIVLEAGIGAALIVGFRPRFAVPAGLALMALFIVVLAVAMANGYTGSCGCFGGASSRGPADALVEDVAFLGLGAFALFGSRRGRGPSRLGRARWQLVVTVLAFALGFSGWWLGPGLPLPAFATAAAPGRAFDHVVVEEVSDDVRRGTRIVAILDPSGEGPSVAALEPLAALAGAGLPPVVGVFEGSNEEMVSFLFEHAPSLDAMGHATRNSLRRFYRRLPVVLALRDGTIVEAWHERVPSPDEARRAFAAP